MSDKVRTVAVCVPQVPFVRGGAELHAAALCQALEERGYEATLITIPFRWDPREQIGGSCLVWRLLDLSECNGKRIDLVIATKFPAYVIKHQRKVVWLCHQFRQVYDLLGTEYSDFTDSPPDRAVRDMVVRIDDMALREARKVFTISKTVSQRLLDYNGIVATPLYHPPPAYHQYCPGKMGNYILGVGRLDPLKRFGPLVEAMRYTKKRLRCVIVGAGSEHDRLQSIVESNGLQKRVKFIPATQHADLVALYSGALAVYHAPFAEDLGYVTLEAFLSEKPVVTAPDSGGPTEFVEDGVTGIVSELQPESLAKALDRLHADRVWAAELGKAGRRSIEQINWDSVVSQLVSA